MSNNVMNRSTALATKESGQALVSFAVAVMAMMAMLAVGLDLALVVGAQRRFDQNGADAGALAIGRLLAGNVSPVIIDGSDKPVFNIPDEYVYALARQYAGLAPGTATDRTIWSSTTSTGVNQSPGLVTRTRLAVTVEYWGTQEWGATWCYSPTGPMPQRAGGVPRCTLFDYDPDSTTDLPRPPRPDPNLPFKVRVTVSSTVDGYFSRVIGMGDGAPPPPALEDNRSAACIRPHSGAKTGSTWRWTPLSLTAAPGRTACAHATVVVSGSADAAPGLGLIPVTTASCRVGSSLGDLFELWGSNPRDCDGSSMGQFKNVLDLSVESTWCDGSPYEYSYSTLMPPGAVSPAVPTSTCTAGGASWQRDGFVPDASRPGGIDAVQDVTYWISMGFNGTVRADTQGCSPACTDGNWLPSYLSATPGQAGNLGQNISSAFYCQPGKVTDGGNGCQTSVNFTGTYFFARNKPGFYDRCPDEFGASPWNLGCRAVNVIVWADPQRATGGTWTNGSSNPDRLRAARILTFLVYCDHDADGYCTKPPPNPPSGITGSGSSSGVFGRFTSIPAPPGTGGGGGGVSYNSNAVNFE